MPASDETAPVGHDGADTVCRGITGGTELLEDGRHPGGGQVEQSDVVLAQVRPLCRAVLEGGLESGAESARRAEVDRKAHHTHGGL